MNNFRYGRASDVADAVRQMAADPEAKLIAGGTNLLDLMKEDVEKPTRLIDISRLPLREVAETKDDGAGKSEGGHQEDQHEVLHGRRRLSPGQRPFPGNFALSARGLSHRQAPRSAAWRAWALTRRRRDRIAASQRRTCQGTPTPATRCLRHPC